MTGLPLSTTPGGTTGQAMTATQVAAALAASKAANPYAQWGGLSDPSYWTGGSNAPGWNGGVTSTSGSGPGALTTEDWQKLIAGDAGLQSAEAALSGSQAADQNALGAEFKNAYETFGKPVDLSSLASQLGMTQADVQNYLGTDAQKVAQENTDAGLSTTSRLDQANQNAIRAITANLNKRGLLNSGETGYQLDQQNLGYRQAQSDAYSKFLGYLQQYQQGYLTAQQQRAASLAAAISAAADRQYGLYQSPSYTNANNGENFTPPPAPPGGATPNVGGLTPSGPTAGADIWSNPNVLAAQRKLVNEGAKTNRILAHGAI